MLFLLSEPLNDPQLLLYKAQLFYFTPKPHVTWPPLTALVCLWPFLPHPLQAGYTELFPGP